MLGAMHLRIGWDEKGEMDLPCMRDEDVVERIVALAEAREADSDYHCDV